MSEDLGQAAAQPGYTYRIVQAPFDSELFKQCTQLRMEVFVDEQKYSIDEEMDEHDPHCIHLLLLAEQNGVTAEPIAVGNLRYFPPPKSKVGRVAVKKSFRGKGLGGVMMKGLEAMLRGELRESPLFKGQQAKEIVLHAQGEGVYALMAVKLPLSLWTLTSSTLSSTCTVPVVPFYLGLGFKTEGEEFMWV